MSDQYKTLSSRLSHLVANSLYSDFTFHVAEDNQSIPAHKSIIAAGSPVLHRIVCGLELAPSSGTSETVTEISSENFIELLRFLYTDTANVIETNAKEILAKATYYGITELENLCVRVLIRNMSVQNVLSIYQQVGHFEIDKPNALLDCLRHRCKRTIAFLTKLAFKSDDFFKLSLEVLRLILNFPALNIDSFDLFWMLLSWARYECGRKKLPKTETNLRLALDGVEKMVGFEAMSAEEFERCQHLCSGFFSKEDIETVLQGGEPRREMTLFKGAVWIARKITDQLPPSAVFINNSSSSYIGRYYDRGFYLYLELDTQRNNYKHPYASTFEVLCGSGYEWTEVDILTSDTITNAVALNSLDDHPLIFTRNTLQEPMELYCRVDSSLDSIDEPLPSRFFDGRSRITKNRAGIYAFDFTDFKDNDIPKDTVHPVKSNNQRKVYYLNGKNAKPPLEPGVIPVDAVIGGSHRDGTPLYVCRAIHDGDMLPGYHIQGQGFAYVSHRMNSYSKMEYELVRHPNPIWVPARLGEVPMHAVHGGHTVEGEELYICRCRHSEGNWIPGKLVSFDELAYIAYDDAEISFQDYEVLVDRLATDSLIF